MKGKIYARLTNRKTTLGLSEVVRVMARAEGYAMVRFPGCMPFVVPVKEIELLPAGVSR